MSDPDIIPERNRISPREIRQDPQRFQSRAEYPIDAMESDLTDERYVELYAGILSLWRDPPEGALYVIDGHRRLELARRAGVSQVLVQCLDAPSEADAFAKGVLLNLAQWAFERGDKLLWAMASRRAAVERALHTRWLDPDGQAATELYEYYPDLGRRYSSFPENHKEAATV